MRLTDKITRSIALNRPYSNSRYWTGARASLNGGSRGGISLKRDKGHLRLLRLPALASVAVQ